MNKLQPKLRWYDVFLHLIKSGKLVRDLLSDERIGLWRKVAFSIAFIAVLVMMFFGDLFTEGSLSVAIPVLGSIIGIPLDGGFDWIALTIAVINLVNWIFPPQLISEHYRDIFNSKN